MPANLESKNYSLDLKNTILSSFSIKEIKNVNHVSKSGSIKKLYYSLQSHLKLLNLLLSSNNSNLANLLLAINEKISKLIFCVINKKICNKLKISFFNLIITLGKCRRKYDVTRV